MSPPPENTADTIRIGLSAVIVSVENGAASVLSVRPPEGHGARFGRAYGLPFGPFDPARHRTFEIGLRAFVEDQTHVKAGFVEQLYTFGDRGREAPIASLDGAEADARIVSVGYVALAPHTEEMTLPRAAWRPWRLYFPWEDWLTGEPPIIEARIRPRLSAWMGEAKTPAAAAARRERAKDCFGFDGAPWDETKVLERYELMYEAGLAAERHRDLTAAPTNPLGDDLGEPMISDHRRILATAIGRLRGKMKYRPIIFDLMPDRFTLFELQRTTEALIGFPLHKQNFRRHVEKSGLVERTEEISADTGGRPAALFRFKRGEVPKNAAIGLATPRQKAKP